MRRFSSIFFLVLMAFGLSAQTVSTPSIYAIEGEYPTRVVATIPCATDGATRPLRFQMPFFSSIPDQKGARFLARFVANAIIDL